MSLRGTNWRERICAAEVPVEVRSWLFETGSLTRRLRTCCDVGVTVAILDQAWERPIQDEIAPLRIRVGERTLVRQVQLLCNGVPFVFARSVVPARTLKGAFRRLPLLGTRPLADILFANRAVRRDPMQYARLAPGTRLHGLARAGLGDTEQDLWGRRSRFTLGTRRLLLTEVFSSESAHAPR